LSIPVGAQYTPCSLHRAYGSPLHDASNVLKNSTVSSTSALNDGRANSRFRVGAVSSNMKIAAVDTKSITTKDDLYSEFDHESFFIGMVACTVVIPHFFTYKALTVCKVAILQYRHCYSLSFADVNYTLCCVLKNIKYGIF